MQFPKKNSTNYLHFPVEASTAAMTAAVVHSEAGLVPGRMPLLDWGSPGEAMAPPPQSGRVRDRERTSVRMRDGDVGRGCSRTTVDRAPSSMESAATVPARETEKSAGGKDNLSQKGGSSNEPARDREKEKQDIEWE